MEIKRVIIVGMGLMGGSMALALHGQVRQQVGIDRDEATRAAALSAGVVTAVATDLSAVDLQADDLLVLATPVRAVLALLDELPQAAPHGCMVIDLGSTKSAICAAMDALPEWFEAIGGHPMCGREVGGFDNASADLYRDKTFILTPTQRTTERVRSAAETLIAIVGAKVRSLEAGPHDEIVATISHVPYVVSALLMQVAADSAETHPELWQIAASGFRDTSRLAGTSPTMMRDILLTNRVAVTAQLRAYRAELDGLLALLDSAESDPLFEWLNQTQLEHRNYRSTQQ
jgi:prephenate dehydrogenase